MALENELFKICKALFLYGGVLVQEMPDWSKFSRNLYKLVSLIIQTLYVSCLPLFLIEIFMVFGTDMEAAVSGLKCMTFIAVVVAKMFIVQSKKITKLIESVCNEELNIIASTNSKIKRIHRGHVIYCNIIVSTLVSCLFVSSSTYVGDVQNILLVIILGLYRSIQFYKTHSNITEATPKPHPVQFWFPFNKNKHYKIAMAYQIFHIMQTVIYNGAGQSLISSVMIFLKAELKILQHNIRTIDPKGTNNKFNEKISSQAILKEYAQKHEKLIRWVQEFNESFQYIILLEYCVSSLTLAFALIEILQGMRMAFNAAFFTMGFLQLFVLSWNANEILLESSSGLSDSLYECAWYDLDKQSKTFILIMIARCRKPLAISIGPFGFMTLAAALSRMKMAYSVVSAVGF